MSVIVRRYTPTTVVSPVEMEETPELIAEKFARDVIEYCKMKALEKPKSKRYLFFRACLQTFLRGAK